MPPFEAKSLQPNEPRKLPRIERTAPLEVQDETGLLWALSYSDFLMVLLSFFIIFFSFEQSKNNAPSVPNTQSEVPVWVKELAAEVGGIWKPVDGALVVPLPDSIYSVGSTELTSQGRHALERLLAQIDSRKQSLRIVFTGHSDGVPVRSHADKVLRNNFDLSSLRATRALQIAVHRGFAPDRLSATGSAEFGRANRTLTLSLFADSR